jgi:hypothetical protein
LKGGGGTELGPCQTPKKNTQKQYSNFKNKLDTNTGTMFTDLNENEKSRCKTTAYIN